MLDKHRVQRGRPCWSSESLKSDYSNAFECESETPQNKRRVVDTCMCMVYGENRATVQHGPMCSPIATCDELILFNSAVIFFQ